MRIFLLALTACSTTVQQFHYTIDPGAPDETQVVPLVANTTPEALVAMNEAMSSGGWWGDDGVYDLERPTYADAVLIRNRSGDVADFGKVEVHLAGQSTAAQWTPTTIPNFKLDSDLLDGQGPAAGGPRILRMRAGDVRFHPSRGAVFNAAPRPPPAP